MRGPLPLVPAPRAWACRSRSSRAAYHTRVPGFSGRRGRRAGFTDRERPETRHGMPAHPPRLRTTRSDRPGGGHRRPARPMRLDMPPIFASEAPSACVARPPEPPRRVAGRRPPLTVAGCRHRPVEYLIHGWFLLPPRLPARVCASFTWKDAPPASRPPEPQLSAMPPGRLAIPPAPVAPGLSDGLFAGPVPDGVSRRSGTPMAGGQGGSSPDPACEIGARRRALR